MKTIKIELPQEVVNEIQRAGLEVNARQGVIDRYFEKHMNDEDESAINAKPFQYFMSLLAEAEANFELAKEAITETYVMEINIKCDCDIPELNEE